MVKYLLVALQKTPSLLGAECKGVVRHRFHANERRQNEGLYLWTPGVTRNCYYCRKTIPLLSPHRFSFPILFPRAIFSRHAVSFPRFFPGTSVSAFSFPDIFLSRQTKKPISKKQEFTKKTKKIHRPGRRFSIYKKGNRRCLFVCKLFVTSRQARKAPATEVCRDAKSTKGT